MKYISNKVLVLVLSVFFTTAMAQNINVNNQMPRPMSGTGVDAHQEDTPIDMYEGALMIVATSMIAGYYFVRNRKQVN